MIAVPLQIGLQTLPGQDSRVAGSRPAFAALSDAPAADLEQGFAAHRAGNLAVARCFYEAVIRHEPHNIRALFLQGSLLASVRETRSAIMSFQRCLALQPGLAIAHNALGNLWLQLREHANAAAAYRQATRCEPPCLEAFCNLGSLLRSAGKVDEAIALYQQALVMKPDSVEVLCNLGVACKALNRLDEALDAYSHALACKPDLAEAHFNESLLWLLKGDYARGWPKHEYRWLTEQRHARRDFRAPLWLGREPLAGKTILLHAEQGLGDTLQFVRYVPLVAQQGACVVLEAQAPLKPVLTTLPGVSCLVVRGDPLPAFDFHCPLLSLPLACAQGGDYTPPAPASYLRAPEDRTAKWREPLAGISGPKIGLVWFGNREHRNDRNRSLPPGVVATLVKRVHGRLISLQKGIRDSGDAAIASMPGVVDLAPALGDFADTAAIIEQLDLVISVDTSAAHLAGALGKPVWILLPFAPDWRWMLHRADSPWYPSARLFRQESIGDWAPVLQHVVKELRQRFAGVSLGTG